MIREGVLSWKSSSSLLFSLGYRNACRTGGHHNRLQGEDLKHLHECAEKYPSLVPYIIAHEGACPSLKALEVFSWRVQKQLDIQAMVNDLFSTYVPTWGHRELGISIEVSPYTHMLWGDNTTANKAGDPLTSWIIAGLPGAMPGLTLDKGSRMVLRTDSMQEVFRLRHLLESLASRKYLAPIYQADILVRTPVVGPDQWQGYLQSWDKVGAMLAKRYPSWYQKGDALSGTVGDYRSLCALNDKAREGLLSNGTLSLGPEFSGGGILFKGVPLTGSWDFPVVHLLVALAKRVFKGMLDTRPYVLPSTGLLRCSGVSYETLSQAGESALPALVGDTQPSWIAHEGALTFRRHLEGVTGLGVMHAGNFGVPGPLGIVKQKKKFETDDEGSW